MNGSIRVPVPGYLTPAQRTAFWFLHGKRYLDPPMYFGCRCAAVEIKTFTVVHRNSLDESKLMISHITIDGSETLKDALERIEKDPSDVMVFEGKHYRVFIGGDDE